MHMLSISCRCSKIYSHMRKFKCFIRKSSSMNFKTSVSLSKRAYLLEKDKIPQEYELIYHAPMELYITIAKNISTITTFLISTAAVYTATNQYNIPASNMEYLGLVSQPNDFWYFTFGFIVITFIMRIFVARYPLRIYHSKKRYIAIFDSQLPFRSLTHIFCKHEVKRVESKLNPWNNCTYRLGNRTSLILSQYFRTPADYNQMMGYN